MYIFNMFFGEHIHVRSSGTESESNTERCSACRWTCHEITIVYYSAILGSAKGSRFFKGNFWDFFTVTGRWAQPTYGSSIPAAHRTSTCSGATHSSSRRHTTTHLKWWPQRSLTPAGWYWPRVLLWPDWAHIMVTWLHYAYSSSAVLPVWSNTTDLAMYSHPCQEYPQPHKRAKNSRLDMNTRYRACSYTHWPAKHHHPTVLTKNQKHRTNLAYNKHSRQYATTILETRRQMLLHCHTNFCSQHVAL